jgi:hypothetical protein
MQRQHQNCLRHHTSLCRPSTLVFRQNLLQNRIFRPPHPNSLLHVHYSRIHLPSYSSFIPTTGPTFFFPLPLLPVPTYPPIPLPPRTRAGHASSPTLAGGARRGRGEARTSDGGLELDNPLSRRPLSSTAGGDHTIKHGGGAEAARRLPCPLHGGQLRRARSRAEAFAQLQRLDEPSSGLLPGPCAAADTSRSALHLRFFSSSSSVEAGMRPATRRAGGSRAAGGPARSLHRRWRRCGGG